MRIALLFLLLTSGVVGSESADQPLRPISPTVSRQELRKILEDPLFHRWKIRQERAQNPTEVSSFTLDESMMEWCESAAERIATYLEEFWDWLWDGPDKKKSSPWFNFNTLGGIAGPLQILGWVALAVLLAYLSIVLLRHFGILSPPVGTARVLSRKQVDQAMNDGEALAMEQDEWLALADRLEAEHEFRSVYRALYLALLSGLHKAGKIDFRRNRTNWSYVNRFRGHSTDQNDFAELTDLFDHVWYGLKPATHTSIHPLRSQVRSLLASGESDE
ncbi:MAG: DUF4129 domain-containing protein [Planctomycetota bacterium]|jgi:hypothetical protein